MPPLANSWSLCQFITCLVPRIGEAPGQEAKKDISATLGLRYQFFTCLVPRVIEAPGQEAKKDISASLGLYSSILLL